MNINVVVYGLSSEGYSIACLMSIKGANVNIIDESTSSAIHLKPEIAKTYPTISSIKEDEPLLSVTPIDLAISNSDYLFFTPRIRKTDQDTKNEINSKFRDAVNSIKKNSSVVYNLPTGLGGNNENITLLEHITGFETGKTLSYFYYPLVTIHNSNFIGSFNNKNDDILQNLLTINKKKKFISISSAEQSHAIYILSNFLKLCSILEVCKFVKDDKINDTSYQEYSNIFLDDMTYALYDLRCLGSSFDNINTLMYLINGSIKNIDGYIKRLIDQVRFAIKTNDLKASRTKIIISWALDPNEIRGDKLEMLQTFASKLRDYVADVDILTDHIFDLFHNEKSIIVIACSKNDLDNILKKRKDLDMIIIKTNPFCEII